MVDSLSLSIITVTYNAERTLENTIKSVLDIMQQNRLNMEYLIVDGKSSDGTVRIIKYYEKQLSYWISEPDMGVYDAMNKAVQHAQGKYVYFLGADDILLDIPYDKLKFADQKNIEIVYGNVLQSNGKIFVSEWRSKMKYHNTLHHQGLFIARKLLLKNPFDLRYPVYADFDLNQKFYKAGISHCSCGDMLISKFYLDGLSGTVPYKEKYNIIRSNFGLMTAVIAVLWTFLGQCKRRIWERFADDKMLR